MTTRVLSISTLFPSRARPGFGRFVARQFDAIVAAGEIDLTVICPVARTSASGDPRGYPVHYVGFGAVPFVGARWNPALIARAVLPLARKLHAERPFDLVDAQFFYPDGPAAARIARELGVPLSIKARGSDIHHWGGRAFARRMMLEAAGQAAGLLAVSGALKRDMIELGMPRDTIAVHYTGLDHELYRVKAHGADSRTEFGFSRDRQLLVGVGNLVGVKRHELTLAAMEKLPGAQLGLAGSGPELRRLESLAARLGLGERVRFLGNLPPDRVARLLQSADAMVLPSENEGLANIWLEALACGAPLVITDVGGAREVVTMPSAGRLVEPTAEAIAAGVSEMVANPPARAEVAAHAARFSWEANAAQLAEHYRRVAGAGPPSRVRRS